MSIFEEYQNLPIVFRLLCGIIKTSDKTNVFISSDIVQTMSPTCRSRMALKLPLASVTFSSPEKQVGGGAHIWLVQLSESQSEAIVQEHPVALGVGAQSKKDNIWLNLKSFGFDYGSCWGLVKRKLSHICMSNHFRFR